MSVDFVETEAGRAQLDTLADHLVGRIEQATDIAAEMGLKELARMGELELETALEDLCSVERCASCAMFCTSADLNMDYECEDCEAQHELEEEYEAEQGWQAGSEWIGDE